MKRRAMKWSKRVAEIWTLNDFEASEISQASSRHIEQHIGAVSDREEPSAKVVIEVLCLL